LLENEQDLQVAAGTLGDGDVTTTIIDMHVLIQGGWPKGVHGPL
jgi:hypothetical protein